MSHDVFVAVVCFFCDPVLEEPNIHRSLSTRLREREQISIVVASLKEVKQAEIKQPKGSIKINQTGLLRLRNFTPSHSGTRPILRHFSTLFNLSRGANCSTKNAPVGWFLDTSFPFFWAMMSCLLNSPSWSLKLFRNSPV